jgi:4-amino-4-deoxy-L-arabinose transferase-like glycosyltransferase
MGTKKPKNRKINIESILSSVNSKSNFSYFGLIIIATAIFIFVFMKLGDINNNYIKHHAHWIFTSQLLLYFSLIILFAYLGYCYLNNKFSQNIFKVIIILGFVLIILVQALAFNPALSMNGDNARYICGAISLATTGKYKSIQNPQEEYITLDQPGVSIMLTPLIKIFGTNIIAFKILTFLLTIGSFFLFFILLKKLLRVEIALGLTMLFGTHPYVSDFSSLVMTEMPFVFFSLLSIWLLDQYDQNPKINYPILILSAFSILMTYFTRSVGIGMAFASILYFLLKKDWQKAAFLGIAVLILIGGWQLRNSLVGSGHSQLAAFTGGKGLGLGGILFMLKKGTQDFITSLKLMPQVLFAHNTTRFKVNPFGIIEFLVLIIISTGLITNLVKNHRLYDLFFILSLLVLCIGSPDSNPLPMARYLCVFVPFYLVYFYLGLEFICSLWKKSEPYNKIIVVLLILLPLFSNFSGTSFRIQLAHMGFVYPRPVENYLIAGKWLKYYSPRDAVIACRKEEILYLFSNRKGIRSASYWTTYGQEYETATLEKFEHYNVSFVVIDSFSNSLSTVYKIIQNNKDKFKLVKIIGDRKTGACYIYEVQKWWNQAH